MNLGLRDAVTLGDALSVALRGREDKLDEYAAGSRAEATHVVALAHRLTRLATAPGRFARCAMWRYASSHVPAFRRGLAGATLRHRPPLRQTAAKVTAVHVLVINCHLWRNRSRSRVRGRARWTCLPNLSYLLAELRPPQRFSSRRAAAAFREAPASASQSEAPETAPSVEKKQSRLALMLVVPRERLTALPPPSCKRRKPPTPPRSCPSTPTSNGGDALMPRGEESFRIVTEPMMDAEAPVHATWTVELVLG